MIFFKKKKPSPTPSPPPVREKKVEPPAPVQERVLTAEGWRRKEKKK